MINFNGNSYSKEPGKIIQRLPISRASYNALDVYQNNIVYAVTESNGDINFYLGSTPLGEVDGNISAPSLGEITLIANKYRSNTVGIQWKDPDDITSGGAAITAWKKTVVVRNANHYPTSPEDGVIIVTERMKNSYYSNYFYDTNLTNGTTYYYTIFTQSNYDTWSNGTTFSMTPNSIGLTAISNLKLKNMASDGFKATWTLPPDIAETSTTFGFTCKNIILVYNANHIPTSPTDGTSVTLPANTRTYTSGALDFDTTYYVSVYTLSTDNAYSEATSASVYIKDWTVMGVKIAISTSAQATAVTYTENATSMTAKSDDWDDWYGCYPVILAEDGTEVGELDKNDYTKFASGADASDYLAAEGYDVMVAFPILGVKMWNDSSYQYINLTDNPNAESDGYTYYAHTKGTTKKDKFYVGAYLGYNDSSKLHSWSGKTPSGSITMNNLRTYAQVRGDGYQLLAFYQWTFLQCLYLLKYKARNCQNTLGRGWVDASDIGVAETGLTNAKGFNYGSTSSGTDTTNNRVKCLGIEDLWGNLALYLDGCWSGTSHALYTSTTNTNFASSTTNYTLQGTMAGTTSSYYLQKILGTSETGFMPNYSTSASATTYYCDYARTRTASRSIIVGGAYNNTTAAGIFRMYSYYAATSAQATIGGRLCYL